MTPTPFHIVSTLVMVVTTSASATNTVTTPQTVLVVVVVVDILLVVVHPYIHPDSTLHELLTLLVASLVVVAKLEVVLAAIAFANLVVDCVPTQLNDSWDFSNSRITFMATCHPRLPHILHHLMMNLLATILSPANPPNLWISITRTIITQKTYTTLTMMKPTLINILHHSTTLLMTIPIILTLTPMTTDPSAPHLLPYMIVLLTPETSMLHILTLSP